MTSPLSRRHRCCSFLSLVGLLLGFPLGASAQVVTWYWVATGAGTTDNYSDQSNWSGGVVPPNDGTARLELPLATGPEQITLPAGALALDSLYFSFGQNAYYGTSYRFASTGATTLSLAAGMTSPNNGWSRTVKFDASVAINLTADQTWTTSNNTVDGAIGGPGKLTISPHYYYTSSYLNQGYLQLNGPGNFTGGLSVYNTTITLGHAHALDGGGEVYLSNVRLETPLTLTLSRPLTVAGTISHYRSDGDGHITFAGPITLLGGATFDNLDYSSTAQALPMVISGNIAESAETPGAGLTLDGGMIVLSGTNTYAGDTHINGYALFATPQAVAPTTTFFGGSEGYAGVAFTEGVQAGFIDHISSESFDGTIGFDTLSGPTQVFSANLDLSLRNQYFGLGSATSAIIAGTIDPGEGNDYRFGNGGGALTVTSDLIGERRVMVQSTGYHVPTTVVLRGHNTFTGGTEVNGGLVIFDGANALPATGTVILAATGSELNTAYAGVTEGVGLTPNEFLARLDLRAPQPILGLDSIDPHAPRTISDAIDLSLGQQAGETRKDPYFLGTATRVILTGPITTGGGSVPLQLTGFKGGELIVDSTLGAVIPSVVIGLDLANANNAGLAGTVRLNGANTYASGTLFNSGVLALGHDTALGTGTLTLAANSSHRQLLFADGLTLANAIQGSYGSLDLGAADSFASLTLTGAIDTHLNFLGSGALTYAGTNPHLGSLNTSLTGRPAVVFAREGAEAGTVMLMSGSLSVDASTEIAWMHAGPDATVEIAAGKILTLGYNNYSEGPAAHAMSGAISGAGRLRIDGNSAALLGDNNFSGGLELNNGTAAFREAAALGTGSIIVTAQNGSYFESTLLTLAPDQTIANAIVLQTAQDVQHSGLTISGAETFFYGEQPTPGNRNLTLTGAISGQGGLRKQSDNTVTLTGANTFAGDITVERGTLVFASASTVGAATNRLQVGGYGSQGTIAHFSAGNPQIGGLSGGDYGSATVELADGVGLTIGVHDQGETGDQAFFGTIEGNGSIIKDGPARQTFAGANTYTGGTTVKQGTLVAGHNQAFGTGAVTLDGGRLSADAEVTFTNPILFGANGGVLGGNGTFTQALTIGAGVGLAPGYSPGAMTFSDLTLAGGGFLEFEIADPTAGAGDGYDTLQVNGTLDVTATAGSPFTIFLKSLDGGWQPGALEYGALGNTYTLTLATSGNLTGFNPANFQIDASAFTTNYAWTSQFSLSASGNDIVLNFTPVPEPSTYALLASGLGLLWFIRRRRGQN